MTRIEEIEARLEAAAPTLWKCDGFTDGDVIDLGLYEDTDQARVVALGITTREDADLLLNASADIAYLLVELRAAVR